MDGWMDGWIVLMARGGRGILLMIDKRTGVMGLRVGGTEQRPRK